MADMSKTIEKAIRRQADSLVEEGRSASCQVEKIAEFQDEETPTLTGVVSNSVKALISGGTLHGDFLQIFQVDSSELRSVYFQPYSAFNPLPGEHHAIIQGAVPSAFLISGSPWTQQSLMRIYVILVILTLGSILFLKLGKPRIKSADPTAEENLKHHPQLSKIIKGLKHEWPVGTGVISFDWTLQVRPLGNGKSHVVLRAGRYGGFTTYRVGIFRFVSLCRELGQITETEQVAEGSFLTPAKYSEAALEVLTGAANA